MDFCGGGVDIRLFNDLWFGGLAFVLGVFGRGL